MRLINNDWLSIILRKLKLSPLSIGLLFFFLYASINLFCTLYFKAWYPKGNIRGLTTEPSSWVSDLLLQPVIIAYFFWIQHTGNKIVDNIVGEGVIGDSPDSRKIYSTASKYLQSTIPPLLSIIFSLAGVFTFNLIFTTNKTISTSLSWITIHPAIVWIRLPLIFITIYSLLMFIYDAIIMIIVLNLLFKNQVVQIEPFHPDNAGGLNPIGSFSANLGYLIGVFGIDFSIAAIQAPSHFFQDYPLIICIVLYITLAPIIFFLPLWTAHKSMVKYQERLSLEISNEFDNVIKEVRISYSKPAKEIEHLLLKLRALQEIKKTVEQFPVWPFNSVNIKKFVSLVISPLVPGIIAIIFEQIVKIF